MRIFSFLILPLLAMLIYACSSGDGTPPVSYPEITTFKTAPSDRFIVDINTVVDGHNFIGENANYPHPGMHVHFDNTSTEWPKGGSDPEHYPKIYAVADGRISSIEPYYQVQANVRYGIQLDFAQADGQILTFNYSIEPMINPNDNGFYEAYINVSVGQTVSKGDVIAYMYLSNNPSLNDYPHIHFNIVKGAQTANSVNQVPAIFSNAVMNDYQSAMSIANSTQRNYDGNSVTGDFMGACAGYKISAKENPYNSGASPCLN